MDVKEEGKHIEGRMLQNFASNLVFMLINFTVGMLLVPFFLDTLGVAAYAIIPVATSMTSYITMITDCLSTTVSRFITIEMGTDRVRANKTFNTAVVGFTGIVVSLIPVILVVSLLAPSVFDISTNTVIGTQILFVLILAAVLINVWSNSFVTVVFSQNRIDLINIIKTVQVLMQLILILLFFVCMHPGVEYVGAAYFLASLAYALLAVFAARKVCPELKLSRKQFSREEFRLMTGVSGWALINSLGNMLFIQASLLLVNIFMGAEAGGQFGIIVMVVSAVSALVDTVATIFTPTIYRLFSQGRRDTVNSLVAFATRFVGILMSMPIAFLCAFSDEIITLWVGGEYTVLTPIIIVASFVMLGVGSITPTYPLTMAYLKIRVPGIVTFLFGLVNIVSAVAVMMYTDLGMLGVILCWGITMFVKNNIFNAWYNAKVAGMKPFVLMKQSATGYCLFLLLFFLYSLLNGLTDLPLNWATMIFLGVVLLAVHMVVTFVFLRGSDKEVVELCVPKSILNVVRRMKDRS